MLNPYLIERFLQIGNESGSLGRLKMWQYIYDAFATSPFFGYGAGNAIVAIENVSNYDFWEDNVHNYYAQTLLDFGIVGFLIFLSVMCFVFIKELKRRFSNFLGGYILIFGIASLVQFRGAEAIFWFVFGLYQGQIIWNRRKTLNDQNSSTYTSL
jgi:O-antigen ligase